MHLGQMIKTAMQLDMYVTSPSISLQEVEDSFWQLGDPAEAVYIRDLPPKINTNPQRKWNEHGFMSERFKGVLGLCSEHGKPLHDGVLYPYVYVPTSQSSFCIHIVSSRLG